MILHFENIKGEDFFPIERLRSLARSQQGNRILGFGVSGARVGVLLELGEARGGFLFLSFGLRFVPAAPSINHV